MKNQPSDNKYLSGEFGIIQNLSYFNGQTFNRERFLDKMHSLIQDAVVCDEIGRVSRHKQTFKLRFNFSDHFRQIPTIHLRHDHIGDQQFYLSSVGFS